MSPLGTSALWRVQPSGASPVMTACISALMVAGLSLLTKYLHTSLAELLRWKMPL